jgi:hypothetical protein
VGLAAGGSGKGLDYKQVPEPVVRAGTVRVPAAMELLGQANWCPGRGEARGYPRPGARRAAVRRIPPCVGALVGIAVSALDRPHGSVAAAAVVVAPGVHELTPVRRHFRGAAARMQALGWGSGCAVPARASG